MFTVAYINDETREGVFIGEAASLLEAKALRQVSGDIVLGPDMRPVQNDVWFWDHEAANPKAYVKRAVRNQTPVRLLSRNWTRGC